MQDDILLTEAYTLDQIYDDDKIEESAFYTSLSELISQNDQRIK